MDHCKLSPDHCKLLPDHLVRKARSNSLSNCILKDWGQKRPENKVTLTQKSVSMNLFSSAMFTGCFFVSILQKTPQDVANDSGHMNIAGFLGGGAVLNVRKYTGITTRV